VANAAPPAAAPAAKAETPITGEPTAAEEQRAAIADQAAPAAAEPERADSRLARAEPAAAAERARAASPPPGSLQEAPPATGAASVAGPVLTVVSPSPATRWRVQPDGRVERSTTGGTTWAPAVVDAASPLTAGSSPDPAVCWLVGPAGVIRLTTDGTRFETVTPPLQVDLVAVTATNARIAVVTAVDGRRFRTDDQGMTWAAVAP
jgi:photosystem II stability/assembly factor-like uncharacterized protein